MYLFSRARQAKADKFFEAVPGAVEIAAKVTQITDLEIYVWQTRFGAPVGTITWSCRLESQAQLMEATEKMMADATYVDMALALGEHYEGSAADQLVRVIAGTPSPQPPKFIQMTTATMANGKYAEAMAWGVEMQEFVANELGTTSMFGKPTYGGFADVGWLLGAESAAQLDEFSAWEMSNTEYHERIQAAGGLFVEGSGQQGLIEKIN